MELGTRKTAITKSEMVPYNQGYVRYCGIKEKMPGIAWGLGRTGDITAGTEHKGVCHFQMSRTKDLRLRKKSHGKGLKQELELELKQAQGLEKQAEKKSCSGDSRRAPEARSLSGTCRGVAAAEPLWQWVAVEGFKGWWDWGQITQSQPVGTAPRLRAVKNTLLPQPPKGVKGHKEGGF